MTGAMPSSRAIHEVGHAMAAWSMGGELLIITTDERLLNRLKGQSADGIAVYIMVDRDWDGVKGSWAVLAKDDPTLWLEVESRIAAIAAGHWAEHKAAGKPREGFWSAFQHDQGSADDMGKVRDICLALGDDVYGHILLRVEARLAALFDAPTPWAAVLEVAQLLDESPIWPGDMIDAHFRYLGCSPVRDAIYDFIREHVEPEAAKLQARMAKQAVDPFS